MIDVLDEEDAVLGQLLYALPQHGVVDVVGEVQGADVQPQFRRNHVTRGGLACSRISVEKIHP